MSSLKRTIVGTLVASLYLAGNAMAGTKSKEPPAGYVYEYVTVGHTLVRKLVPITHNPGSYVMSQETGRSEAGPGDYWAYRTVGRRQVRVWMHDVVVNPASAASTGVCTGCSHRYVGMGKHSERRDFCAIDGREVDCTKATPDCPECAKHVERRSDWCEDQVLP